MTNIKVIHGPNLNLLGIREPEIYGDQTLDQINDALEVLANDLGHPLEIVQSSSESVIIEEIHHCLQSASALILNAAAYTHTSVAIRDAVAGIAHEIPTIEVHLSVPGSRETFRRQNLLEDVVRGRVEGFGGFSYALALRAASALIAKRGFLRHE